MILSPEELNERARRIEMVVFDVDGVLTDGLLVYGPNGEATKTFHTHDGHGIVLLRLAGIRTAILSARTSEVVSTRMRELGLDWVLQGKRDKLPALLGLCERAGVSPERVAYIGDDVNDVQVLSRVGLAACPADAVPEALEVAHFVARKPGGRGAARELCELVLKAQGKWTY